MKNKTEGIRVNENGNPGVSIPVEIIQKYGDYIQAVIELNRKLLQGGSVQDVEKLVDISGKILGLAYSLLKEAESMKCVNEEPA